MFREKNNCYCADMNSQNIEKALYFCGENFTRCGIYKMLTGETELRVSQLFERVSLNKVLRYVVEDMPLKADISGYFKELLKKQGACPFIAEPASGCHHLNLNGNRVSDVLYYCCKNFAKCGIYKKAGALGANENTHY